MLRYVVLSLAVLTHGLFSFMSKDNFVRSFVRESDPIEEVGIRILAREGHWLIRNVRVIAT